MTEYYKKRKILLETQNNDIITIICGKKREIVVVNKQFLSITNIESNESGLCEILNFNKSDIEMILLFNQGIYPKLNFNKINEKKDTQLFDNNIEEYLKKMRTIIYFSINYNLSITYHLKQCINQLFKSLNYINDLGLLLNIISKSLISSKSRNKIYEFIFTKIFEEKEYKLLEYVIENSYQIYDDTLHLFLNNLQKIYDNNMLIYVIKLIGIKYSMLLRDFKDEYLNIFCENINGKNYLKQKLLKDKYFNIEKYLWRNILMDKNYNFNNPEINITEIDKFTMNYCNSNDVELLLAWKNSQ